MIGQSGRLGGITGVSNFCPVLDAMKKSGMKYTVKSFIYCKKMSVSRKFLDKLICYTRTIKIPNFVCFSFSEYKNAKLLMYSIFGISAKTSIEYMGKSLNIYEIS